jgi:hypothetical protein
VASGIHLGGVDRVRRSTRNIGLEWAGLRIWSWVLWWREHCSQSIHGTFPGSRVVFTLPAHFEFEPRCRPVLLTEPPACARRALRRPAVNARSRPTRNTHGAIVGSVRRPRSLHHLGQPRSRLAKHPVLATTIDWTVSIFGGSGVERSMVCTYRPGLRLLHGRHHPASKGHPWRLRDCDTPHWGTTQVGACLCRSLAMPRDDIEESYARR